MIFAKTPPTKQSVGGRALNVRFVIPAGAPNHEVRASRVLEHDTLLAQPRLLPKGTTIEVVATFDNSPANKFNPDPTKDVRWGDQTWEEMMIGFFGAVADRAVGRAVP